MVMDSRESSWTVWSFLEACLCVLDALCWMAESVGLSELGVVVHSRLHLKTSPQVETNFDHVGGQLDLIPCCFP